MRGVAAAWRRFWFEPESTASLAVFRIAFGLVALGWTLSLAPDLFPFFGPRGIVPEQPNYQFWFGPLGVWNDNAVAIVAFAVLLAGCAGVVLGWRTRLSSLVVFLGMYAFQRRNPFVFNAGDDLMRLLALYLLLAPAGVALSLDRLRVARDRFWEFPLRAPWPLRLVQIQLSVIYLSTVWAKLQGTTWNDGTAVSYALRIGDLQRFPLPAFVVDWPLTVNLLTWGTLAIEVALGILVWNRRLRPWVLGLGVAMHLLIDYSLLVGFFSLAILTAYIAFVPADAMERALARIRRSRPAEPDPDPAPEAAPASA